MKRKHLALAEADAQLLYLVCRAVAEHPTHTEPVLAKVAALAAQRLLVHTTASTMLRILLVYASPAAAPIATVAQLAVKIVAEATDAAALDEGDLLEDVEDVLLWLAREYDLGLVEPAEDSVQVATDLVADLALRALRLGFHDVLHASLESQPVLFEFVRAKVLQLSAFYGAVEVFQPLFNLVTAYPPFQDWYRGIVKPYAYYWAHYGSHDQSAVASAYFSLDTYQSQFDFLVAPLNNADRFSDATSPSKYFSAVIAPLAQYYDYDLQPVISWMLARHADCATVAEFRLWHDLLLAVLSLKNVHPSNQNSGTVALVRLYIAACAYFGIYKVDMVSSLVTTAIQDEMLRTLDLLILIFDLSVDQAVTSHFGKNFDPNNLAEVSSLREFLDCASNPFPLQLPSPIENDLLALRQNIFLCCSLYSVNNLDLKKCLTLRSYPSADTDWVVKEVVQILNRIDSNNYKQLLSSIDLFATAFISDGASALTGIQLVVFERLILANLYDIAIEYYRAELEQNKILPHTAYDVTIRQFWDLLDNSANLDDRIGKLKLATQCMGVLDVVASGHDFDKASRLSIVKLKHLLKAIHSLKNFKLVIVRNQPATPKQILAKLTQNTDSDFSPITLISIVLEQNPKSYIAFEKLHKIANDFSIFLDLDTSQVSFPKLQSACIESALVDGNFEFAYKHSKQLLNYCVEHGYTEQLSEIWLAFYQVGKYIMPEWFNDYDEKVQKYKLEVLVKQREILSLALKYTKPSASTTDNSKLLVGQFRHVNQEITKWYEEAETHHSDSVQKAVKSTQAIIQENLSGLINDAAQSKNQAGEKLSNLLVSGLGWAIGANHKS